MDTPVQQTFVFQHLPDQVFPLLQGSRNFLQQHLPKHTTLQFKAGVIITELFTNSIKHAGHGPSQIDLLIKDNQLVITKTDAGKPFSIAATDDEQLTWEWPLSYIPHHPIKIYADDLNGLFASVTSPHSLSFYAEDYEEQPDMIANMAEHYGLMIICRAGSTFTYHFNPVTRHNLFKVTVSIG